MIVDSILYEPQNLAMITGSHFQPYIYCGVQFHVGWRRQSVHPTEAITSLG